MRGVVGGKARDGDGDFEYDALVIGDEERGCKSPNMLLPQLVVALVNEVGHDGGGLGLVTSPH